LIKQLISILLLFISLCFLSGDSFGYIHDFSGDVLIESNNEKKIVLTAINGRNIGDGNIIRVNQNSYCEIYSDDKRTFIRLDSDTEVKFIETDETREIYLEDGSLYISNRNPEIAKKTFVFADFSQIYLTNSNLWVSSKGSDHDQIYSFGNQIDISDKYKGIRYHGNEINMIHASEEEIVDIESNDPKEDFKHIVPSYIFSDFLIRKETYAAADSLLFDVSEFQLIPDYNENLDAEIFEESNFGFNISSGLAYLHDASYIPIALELYIKYNNMNAIFKIDEYFALGNSEINVNDWSELSTLLSKINHLSYYNNDETILVNVGELKGLTFGHGQVLHKYSNSYNYPIMQRTGLQLQVYPKNKLSYNIDFFVSDLSQIINGGGFLGCHFSYHISKLFPLTIGYGYITDLDQYSEIDVNGQSNIRAHELDFKYELFRKSGYTIDLISEYDAIFFPNTIKYFRYDGSSTGALKQRDKTRGVMFGSKVIFDSGHKVKMGVHINDALYTPYYFSSTYDFEKVRMLRFDEDIQALNLNENSDIPCNDLDGDGECNNQDILYLSKEWHPLFLRGDFVYPTAGASFYYEYNYYNKRGITASGMYLFDNHTNSDKSYYLFDIEFFSKSGYPFKQLNEFSLYFHRNFALSNMDNAKENLMFGTKLDIRLTESIQLIVDIQSVFYDFNQDANVDNVNSFNSQIKYNAPDPKKIIHARSQRKNNNQIVAFSPKHNFKKSGPLHSWLKRINPFKKKNKKKDED